MGSVDCVLQGYIFISDQYALPFANADHLTTVPGESFITKGLCHAAENTLYDGDVTSTIQTDSATECCDSCNNSGGRMWIEYHTDINLVGFHLRDAVVTCHTLHVSPSCRLYICSM